MIDALIGFAIWLSVVETEPAARLPPLQVGAPAVVQTAVGVAGAVTIRRPTDEVFATEPVALLRLLPGLVVRDRSNPAQELQVLARGQGGRASFGIRGLRLYLDGLPLDAADGQGQLANVPLELVSAVEFHRGAASHALAPSGTGAIALYTGPERGLRLLAASAADSGRLALSLGDATRVVHLSQTQSGGWRPHSAFERQHVYWRQQLPLRSGVDVGLIANLYRLPQAEDPLGLTLADYEADRDASAALARQFNTRKTVAADLLGLTARAEHWHAAFALNRRSVEQFLALPVAAQRAPTSAGGVIDFDRDEGFAQLGSTAAIGRGRVGLMVEGRASTEQRHGFENFVDERLGVTGAVRRDERNRYGVLRLLLSAEHPLELGWREPLGLHLGLASSRAGVRTDDRYIAPGNPDDSGELEFDAVGWNLGIAQRFDSQSWWLALADGFEFPTQGELAYRPDGLSGLNAALEPATSRELELGWRSEPLQIEAVLYRSETRDEIAAVINEGGRTRFANQGRSERLGLELLWRFQHDRVDGSVVLNAQRARASELDLQIPAVATLEAQAELGYQFERLRIGVAVDGRSGLYADSQNLQRVPGHLLAHLSARHRLGSVELGLKMDNVFDTRHVASVIVNENRGRVVEPGRGRTVIVGLEWQLD